MSGRGSPLAASGGERLILGAALAASLGLVWLATGQVLVLAAFAAGLLALGGIVWAVARPKPVPQPRAWAPGRAPSAVPMSHGSWRTPSKARHRSATV